MSISSDIEVPRLGRGWLGWGPVWLILATIAAAVLFQDGLRALAAAWATPEYTHGPIIPILSAYLFLHQLKAHPPEPGAVRNRWPGVALVAASIALAMVGIVAGIGDVVAYALILWVGGVVLISFGWARGRHFWPGVLHLVFMLPLPGLLYFKVSTELQLFSSELGVELIRMAGVPVLLDGNIINLGAFKLAVAEACSGLRYLFPIMSFSYVFATLYRGPNWHKAVLLLSAAPITVIMNTVRIAMIGVIVDRYGIEHAEGLSHFLEGWVIFITCVTILFGLAWAMLKLQRAPMSLGQALDMDLTGLGPQLARLRLVRPSGALIAATLLVGGAAAAWTAAPEREVTIPEREPLALLPRDIGDWRSGTPQVLEPSIAQSLGADDYYWSVFRNDAEAAGVDFLISWYDDQTQGGIHSPEVCIPGSGWEIARIETVDIAEDMGAAEPFPVNRAVIQKGTSRQLVYFWFDQAGARTASDYGAKAQLLWNALTLGRSDGALVRLITPIRPKETEAEAEARLQRFLAPALEVLPRFVPGA